MCGRCGGNERWARIVEIEATVTRTEIGCYRLAAQFANTFFDNSPAIR